MNQESRITPVTTQKSAQLYKCKEIAQRAVSVYRQYRERALQLVDAVIDSNRYSLAGWAGQQVAVVSGF